jgi:hypothetical protein
VNCEMYFYRAYLTIDQNNTAETDGAVMEAVPASVADGAEPVMGKILFKSILKIENKIVQKEYFENNKIKYFTKVFSKYKIK